MSEYTGLIGLTTRGQSPINLDDRFLRERRYPSLVLNGHWLNDGEARMFNSGNTAKIFLSGDRIPSTLCGGPLADDVYEFSHAHFHWGEDNCRGAEHTINDTWQIIRIPYSYLPLPAWHLVMRKNCRYSMESHVVHWNRKYMTMEECFRHKDGILVTKSSNFYPIERKVQAGCCSCLHPQLERVTEYLRNIEIADMETSLPANCLAWMRWATLCNRYYTYSGSYNIAEYPECATWIVFPVVIPINASEIQEFRKLRNKDGQIIQGNCREIQLLKCRQIYLAVP